MKTIKDTQKKYCSKAMATAIIVSIILLALGMKPAAKGLILGTLFSIINFILLGQSIPYQLNNSRGKTFLLSFLSIGVRFALLAVPVITAVKSDKFDIISAVVGLFMVQLIILLLSAFNLILPQKRKNPA